MSAPGPFAEALSDRYLLQRELGRGGMATVYLAHDVKHDRPVALKVVHLGAASPLAAERFHREIKLAARLQHPHILSVHDSGTAAGQLWFTMPYVEGETLRERLRREGQLSVDDAVRIATECARALDYAHSHGVIHRDIKPENILLAPDGSTLVADFGIAKALGAEDEEGLDGRLTETGMAIGTPQYMSPEQAAGQLGLDLRTDIYSLGCVTYEMLAGEPPFTGPSPQAVIAKRLSEPVPHLRTLRDVPESVERAVNRALARAPADRFRSAGEFSVALALPSGRPDRGGLALKRLSAWVALALVAATVAGVLVRSWPWRQPGATQPAPERSIAVLPFTNLSPDRENEYFSDGMADELITALSRIQGLRVAARTSAFAFKGKNQSVREIGRQLGVATVLEGSVRRAGERLRVSAQLVDAGQGYQLWADTHERDLRDVFAVQEELSRAIAGALRVRLASHGGTAARRAPDLDAYDLYLRGRHALHRRTVQGLHEARDLFEQAIARDPSFAGPYAGLADVYLVLPGWSDVPPLETLPRAKSAALQALSLDTTLAEPHATLAVVTISLDWDWDAAAHGFRRALALNPNNANTWYWYSGEYLAPLGRLDEAIEAVQRARELDPLSLTISADYGWMLYRAGRYQEAQAHLERMRSVDPDFIFINSILGQIHTMQGRYREAVASFEKAIVAEHSIDRGMLGYALARSGRTEDARRTLRQLEDRARTGYVGGTAMALILAGLADTAGAFRWLQRGFENRDPFFTYVFAIDPMMEGLRQDPRGVRLLRRMGLVRRRD